jgi:(1->4)-alpha-D-glucan 1-alpha-D-glucosylmutase
MRAPVATYRLQLNSAFGFSDAARTAGYLRRLGISHIYASPILKSRRGSPHGYDVVDPDRINYELGSEEDLKGLVRTVNALGMGWIQDIVPNHMAFDQDNPYIRDIIELGEDSEFSTLFDIDWGHRSAPMKGRLLAPFLGRPLKECLRDGEIRLAWDGEFAMNYFGLSLPLSIRSYTRILEPILRGLKEGDAMEVDRLLKRMRSGDGPHDQIQALKVLLGRSYATQDPLGAAIACAVRRINSDRNELRRLLRLQNFRLSYWQAANHAINYRRFFDIGGLICVRVEDRANFDLTHRMIGRLAGQFRDFGVRVDHIDGLRDPATYIKRLRGIVKDSYVVVEKILVACEGLQAWPIQGTTGYEFLNALNGIFIDQLGGGLLNEFYRRRVSRVPFGEVTYRCKRAAAKDLFSGDLDNLSYLFAEELGIDSVTGRRRLKAALTEIMCTLPVYRTYLAEGGPIGGETARLTRAIADSKRRRADLSNELDRINALLMTAGRSGKALSCFMRMQQYSGPLMAKGVEDTALYRYAPLISANDVGGSPETLGSTPSSFHSFNKRRLANWPYAMNATSTHDTKRGEDFRARINAISEFPSEWTQKIRTWTRLNLPLKTIVDGRAAPDRIEELFIYQTMVGAMPFDERELQSFAARLVEHMTKAVREGKRNSSWLHPNVEHEAAVSAFIVKSLDTVGGGPFLKDFLPFQRKVAFYGMLNSLSQVVLKVASPGVPDFYQGSELWDLNMVDPDNRRPVDFGARADILGEVCAIAGDGDDLRRLMAGYRDGRIKIYVTHRALRLRNARPEVFGRGDYMPLEAEGEFHENVIAFCRRDGDDWVLALAPRHLSRVSAEGEFPLGEERWRGTAIRLTEGMPHSWRDVFSGREVEAERHNSDYILRAADLLERFPVALLENL